jgi:thymidylate kinase
MATHKIRGTSRVFHHWIDRFLSWTFDNLYPKPDLVVYLDALPETIYARKPEGKLEYLEKRRIAILEQGKRIEKFVSLDSTQPPESVNGEFERIIINSFPEMGKGVNE